MNVDVETSTTAGIGFYFFLAYCLISMLALEAVTYFNKNEKSR
jgi:hypothetical protein